MRRLNGRKSAQIQLLQRPTGDERGEDGEQREGQAGADQSASSNSSLDRRKYAKPPMKTTTAKAAE